MDGLSKPGSPSTRQLCQGRGALAQVQGRWCSILLLLIRGGEGKGEGGCGEGDASPLLCEESLGPKTVPWRPRHQQQRSLKYLSRKICQSGDYVKVSTETHGVTSDDHAEIGLLQSKLPAGVMHCSRRSVAYGTTSPKLATTPDGMS